MPKSFDFRPIPRNVRALALTDRARRMLEWRARQVRSAAGAGYELQMFRGRNRWRATVRTATPETRRAEATGHHRLVTALTSGRQGEGEATE